MASSAQNLTDNPKERFNTEFIRPKQSGDDPGFVKIAEEDVTRAVRHEVRPVIERLVIMFLEIFAALFHFDEHDRFPDVIGKGSAAAVFGGFADAEFSGAANVE